MIFAQLVLHFDGLLIIALLIDRSAPETPNKKSGTKCSVASAIQESQGIARGFRLKEGEHPSALNGFLYSLLRATKQQRRALVLSMLKQFDETSKNPLAQLLYLADNLASFPYQVFWKENSSYSIRFTYFGLCFFSGYWRTALPDSSHWHHGVGDRV